MVLFYLALAVRKLFLSVVIKINYQGEILLSRYIIKGENMLYLDKFYKRCLAMNLRPATIAQYRKVLVRYARAGGDSTPEHIRNYLASLDVAPATRKIHWMTLNVYFNFLQKNRLISYNPMEAVERPKVPKKVMRYFTSAEVKQMIDCWDTHTYSGVRNRTIMLLFLGTGIRRAELAGLQMSDIRWDMDCIMIRGKGGKERTVPLTAELRRILTTYISARNRWMEKKPACNALFLSVQYRQQMTPAGIWSIFARSPLTGERISPHTWRHTFGRAWVLNGGDIVALQQILGHSDIATTRKYISLASEDVAKENAQFNPLANTKWSFY